MYYEEALINGEWCSRMSLVGEWFPFETSDYVCKIGILEKANKLYLEEIKRLNEVIHEKDFN